MNNKGVWIALLVVLVAVSVIMWSTRSRPDSSQVAVTPDARPSATVAREPVASEPRLEALDESAAAPVVAAQPTPIEAKAVDEDKPPEGNLNEWPASKPLRRWLLKRALRDMQTTAGTTQCFSRAHDVLVYSLSAIMNAQGRWEPVSAPFAPHNNSELYFHLNDRAYRPFVGEYPEFDQLVAVLGRRDVEGGNPNEITPELMHAIEARAEAASRILQD